MNQTAQVKGCLDGRDILEYTVEKGSLTAKIINLGACLTQLWVPDAQGRLADVVLGYEDYTQYQANPVFFGCVIGRVTNRIAGGRFTLHGKVYTFEQNEGQNLLHCGKTGYHHRFWEVDEEASSQDKLVLRLDSPDGDGGFPGHVTIQVVYALTDDNGISLEYTAQTDADTYVNLTNHTFFNLDGHDQGDILGHTLWLDASEFTPGGIGLIPTGERKPVKGTPIDFTAPKVIREGIDSDWDQIVAGGGYDSNFCVDHEGLLKVAEVTSPKSGRVMEVLTTKPAIQFYSGNGLPNGRVRGKGGVLYVRRGGLCLEPQYYPDSPNQPSFPSILLKPGEVYRHETVYRFRV